EVAVGVEREGQVGAGVVDVVDERGGDRRRRSRGGRGARRLARRRARPGGRRRSRRAGAERGRGGRRRRRAAGRRTGRAGRAGRLGAGAGGGDGGGAGRQGAGDEGATGQLEPRHPADPSGAARRRPVMPGTSRGWHARPMPELLPDPSTTPRNMVVVLLDSLNRHLLGCYGGDEFETPKLDAFAARSIPFTNH